MIENTNLAKIADNTYNLLDYIGEDPNRDGLLETPHRVAKMYQEVFSGIGQDPASVLKTFEAPEYPDLVVVKDIPLYSMCEHHLLPFFGTASIAYLPSDRIVGLSKFSRMVDILAKRPQVQERLTQQIAETIYLNLKPHFVFSFVEARHMCMELRGVERQGSSTCTMSRFGLYKPNDEAKFLRMIGR